MLTVNHVTKRYADRLVLDDVMFSVSEAEKIALVGPNGSGKSTLLRIIAGEEAPDGGSVVGSFARSGCRYLPQGSLNVAEQVAADLAPGMGEIWRLGRAVEEGAADTPDGMVALLDRFESAGGWTAYGAVEAVLDGLGIGRLRPESPAAGLSGGERTKLGLAALLYRPGPFLLLDEPTNHLDMDSLSWLEDFLRGYQGAVLLVSHDRAVIDAVAESVLELDPATHRLRRFAGGYSEYALAVEHERAGLADAYRRQQSEFRRIEDDIRRVKQRAARFDARSQNDHWRRIGKKVARTAKVRERRLEKQFASADRVAKPKQIWTLKADIAAAERGGNIVIEAEGLALALGGRTLFSGLSVVLRHGERVVLTGANGSGKTSLLRVLLGEVEPDAGRVQLGPSVKPGYLSQQQESLDLDRTPLEEVRSAAPLDETTARTFLHRFLFTGDEVFTPIRSLSFGQRSRLALARLILSGVNLLVLDEPLNHLDIPSRQGFEDALDSFHGSVLAVSHDRYFIHRFAARLLVLEDGTLVEAVPEEL